MRASEFNIALTSVNAVSRIGVMENTIDRAADACGGLQKLANAIGVSIQVVSNWRERGVPIPQCAAVEQASKGAVMRWELRPDDWASIWPELSDRTDAPRGNR
jgi:DNA-binding transcriptional regulator YdaS (Cro superfamily)